MRPTAGAGCWWSTKPIAAPPRRLGRAPGDRQSTRPAGRIRGPGRSRRDRAGSPLATRDLGGFASSLSDHLHLHAARSRRSARAARISTARRRSWRARTGRTAPRCRRQSPALLRLARAAAIAAELRPLDVESRSASRHASVRTRLHDRRRLHRTASRPMIARMNGRSPAPADRRPHAQVAARSQAPSLIPTRPPIRIEEGLVEVGWEGDLETELGRADDAPHRALDPSGRRSVAQRRADRGSLCGAPGLDRMDKKSRTIAAGSPSDAIARSAAPTDEPDEPSPGSDAPPVRANRASSRRAVARDRSAAGVRAEPNRSSRRTASSSRGSVNPSSPEPSRRSTSRARAGARPPAGRRHAGAWL